MNRSKVFAFDLILKNLKEDKVSPNLQYMPAHLKKDHLKNNQLKAVFRCTMKSKGVYAKVVLFFLIGTGFLFPQQLIVLENS